MENNLPPMPADEIIANFAMELVFMESPQLAHELRSMIGALAASMQEAVAIDVLTDRVKMISMMIVLVSMEASNRLANDRKVDPVEFVRSWQSGEF